MSLTKMFEGERASSAAMVTSAIKAMAPTATDIMGASSSTSLFGGSLIDHRAEQYRHNVGTVHAIIKPIANRIARQPVRLARIVHDEEVKDSGGLWHKSAMERSLPLKLKHMANQIEMVEDHEILDSIHNPNPYLTEWALKYVTVISLELAGMAIWWQFRDPETGKLQTYYLPSHWCTPNHEAGLYAFWEVRPENSGESFEIASNEIVYISIPDPADPLSASSTLQAQSKPVVIDESMTEAQRRQFSNGIHPGYAITIGRHPDAQGRPGERPILTPEQREQLITAVKRQYRGATQYDEPMIVDGLIEKIEKITLSGREMDWLNSWTVNKDRLTQAWNINPVTMGQLQGANRASAAAAEDHFLMNVVNPKIILISEILTRSIPPRVDPSEDYILYIEEAKPIDPEFDLTQDLALLNAGAMSRNELRARRGLAPIKQGDSAFVGGLEIPVILQKSSGARREKSSSSLDAGKRRKVIEELWIRNHGTREIEYKRDLEQALSPLSAELYSRLRSEIMANGPNNLKIDELFSMDSWTKTILQITEPVVEEGVALGAATEWHESKSRRSKRLHPQAMALPKDILDAISFASQEILEQPYWSDIAETVREQIVKVVAGGITAGISNSEIVDNLLPVLGISGTAVRCMRIARTETTYILNAGHDASRLYLMELGIVKGRTWLSILDNDTRQEHEDANNETAQGDADFVLSNGEKCQFPGDPRLTAGQRVNCRCTTASELEA